MNNDESSSNNSSNFEYPNKNYALTFNQNQIFLKLLDLGFEPETSLILIRTYPADITFTDFLNRFISDENGIFNHVFIPGDEKPLLCAICQNEQSKHEQIEKEEEEKISAIYKSETNSSEEKKSERSSEIKSLLNRSKLLTDCKICYQRVPDQYIFKIDLINHEICIDCLKNHIITEIQKGKLFPLKCPHCDNTNLTLSAIKQFVDQTTFLKYQRLVVNYAIASKKDFLYCPGCYKVLSKQECETEKRINFQESTEFSIIICNFCSIDICGTCYRKQHYPTKCEALAEKELMFFGRTTDVQKCPNCQAYVEKIKGCNHMTCICQYEFCWLCNGKYTEQHYNGENSNIDPSILCPFKRKNKDILNMNNREISSPKLNLNENSTFENQENHNNNNENYPDQSLAHDAFMRIENQRKKERNKWICIISMGILFLPFLLIIIPVYLFIKDITMSQCWNSNFRNGNCLIQIIVLLFPLIIGICLLPFLWVIMIFKFCKNPTLKQRTNKEALIEKDMIL